MPYCSNCGNQLRDGAKFCDNCGFQVGIHDDDTQRQTVFEGKIHKCPNCGEIVEAFQDDCPSCGYKFRDVKVTSSVKELADKLERIANEKVERNIWGKLSAKSMNAKVQKQVQLIQNFAIPNTYEDLWEFLILSSSNITNYDDQSSEQAALSNAWTAKFEQAYQKAKLVINNPKEIASIEKLYESKSNQAKKAKRTKGITFFAYIMLMFAPAFLIYGIMFIGNSTYESNIRKENSRLTSIVEEIYDCIDNGNYTLARSKAANLSFNYTSDWSSDYEAVAENWDETREELLEIINEAEQKSKNQANTGGE